MYFWTKQKIFQPIETDRSSEHDISRTSPVPFVDDDMNRFVASSRAKTSSPRKRLAISSARPSRSTTPSPMQPSPNPSAASNLETKQKFGRFRRRCCGFVTFVTTIAGKMVNNPRVTSSSGRSVTVNFHGDVMGYEDLASYKIKWKTTWWTSPFLCLGIKTVTSLGSSLCGSLYSSLHSKSMPCVPLYFF